MICIESVHFIHFLRIYIENDIIFKFNDVVNFGSGPVDTVITRLQGSSNLNATYSLHGVVLGAGS